MGALVRHRKPATSSITKQRAQNNMLSLKLSFSSTARGEKEEEWAEEERVAGQTVRGKGSKGPGCPGEGNPPLQQCPHQPSGCEPGPAEVRSPSALGGQRRAQREKGWPCAGRAAGLERCVDKDKM